MCGAPPQGIPLAGVDLASQTVIQGTVVREGNAVSAAFVRLLDASGEFTAEVTSSATGQFRFYAAPGTWTIRALAPNGRGERVIDVTKGLTEVPVELTSVN